MLSMLKSTTIAALGASAALFAVPTQAQSYQIDCAILICLAGGFPASAECTAAKTEMIRRVTPWPVEPPLQLWNCPMGGAGVQLQNAPAIAPLLQSPIQIDFQADALSPIPAVVRDVTAETPDFQDLLQFVQAGGYDLSSPEFAFIRTLRVYHVERLSQYLTSGDNERCVRRQRIRIGYYDSQGEFDWTRGDVDSLPSAYVGDEGFGENCPSIAQRAVFMEWRDYQGTYGWERVNY